MSLKLRPIGLTPGLTDPIGGSAGAIFLPPDGRPCSGGMRAVPGARRSAGSLKAAGTDGPTAAMMQTSAWTTSYPRSDCKQTCLPQNPTQFVEPTPRFNVVR